MMSQKSHRMRKTDYSNNFMSNLDMENGTAEMDPNHVIMREAEAQSPSKVFRSWSRPQIGSSAMADSTAGGQVSLINGKVLKTMQVCTCARFRKRIDPGMGEISVRPLASVNSTAVKDSISVTAKSELGLSPDHNRLRHSIVQGGNQADDYMGTKSEMKGASAHRSKQQEIGSDDISIASPNDRRNQPRMSQDFKMRILTKKKVAVPPSAASQ